MFCRIQIVLGESVDQLMEDGVTDGSAVWGVVFVPVGEETVEAELAVAATASVFVQPVAESEAEEVGGVGLEAWASAFAVRFVLGRVIAEPQLVGGAQQVGHGLVVVVAV